MKISPSEIANIVETLYHTFRTKHENFYNYLVCCGAETTNNIDDYQSLLKERFETVVNELNLPTKITFLYVVQSPLELHYIIEYNNTKLHHKMFLDKKRLTYAVVKIIE